MTQLNALALAMIAIHEIQRPGAKRGQVDTISPGTSFEAKDEEQFEHLRAAGAARPKADTAPVAAAPVAAAADDDNEDDDTIPGDVVDLTTLGVKALRKLLVAKGVEFDTAAGKDQLIALLTPAATDDLV